MEANEFGTVFICSWKGCKREGEFNEMRFPTDPVQGSIPARGSTASGFNYRRRKPCFKSHLLPYSKPRGCLSRHCIIHENYSLLYYNWGLVSRLTTPTLY